MEKNKLNKALSMVFAMALLAGCASTDTQDTSEMDGGVSAGPGAGMADGTDMQDGSRGMDQQAMDLQYVFYFDFDKAVLSSDIRAELDKHIAVLKNNNQNVRLEGHADDRGTREYNMALGERRANAVANYLIINGIARYRIETVSFGEERPVAFGHDEASWQQNRRVELKAN